MVEKNETICKFYWAKFHCQQSQKLGLGACTKITEHRDRTIVWRYSDTKDSWPRFDPQHAYNLLSLWSIIWCVPPNKTITNKKVIAIHSVIFSSSYLSSLLQFHSSQSLEVREVSPPRHGISIDQCYSTPIQLHHLVFPIE